MAKEGITEENWKPALKKVLDKIIIIDMSGCWLWNGYIDPATGYGQVRVGWKLYKVHRFMAFCYLGLDVNDKSLDTCHTCDERSCINPHHLWVGTRSQNILDSVNKGRWHSGGGRNPVMINHLRSTVRINQKVGG